MLIRFYHFRLARLEQRPGLKELARAAIVLVVLVSFSGCGNEAPQTPDSVEVVGEVKLDDELIADAKIVFIPRSLMDRQQHETRLAYGTTNEKGRFELKLADGSSEIRPGEYRVILSKHQQKSSRPPLLADLKTQFPGLVPNEGIANQFAGYLPDEVFPPRFNQNTELVVKIDAELTVNTIKFDLRSIDLLLDESQPQ